MAHTDLKAVPKGKVMNKLFDPGERNYYNYAPCLVQTEPDTKYVFYCSNGETDIVVDYICWRKGTLIDGVWVWGPQNTAFGPTPATWDECHTCDPDVLKGEFCYNGHKYSWAMTYLGVAQWDCNANQIGVAFSDSIEGLWIKLDRAGQNYYMAAEKNWNEQRRCCRETLVAVLDKPNFENGTGKWKILFKYDEENTGYYGNHNPAVGRDPYGNVTEPDNLMIAMSSSSYDGLWSFRINEGSLQIINKKP